MELSSNDRDGTLIVSVNEDRVDATSAVEFKDQMRVLIGGPQSLVVLDLSQVNFLDSSGLGAVVAVFKEVSEGKRLVLAGLTSNVEKVFRLTRMDSVFDIYPDVDAAFSGIAHAS